MKTDKRKICSICGNELPIAEFPKKSKQKWRSYCKNCQSIRNEMLKAKEIYIPQLDREDEIEVRGKLSNGRGYTHFVTYEKAMKMVEEKVAYIVHSRLIKRFFDFDTFKKLIIYRYGEKCFYCGAFADTIDHIIPKSHGGLSSFSNCVPACSICNETKDSMVLEDFLFYYDPSAVFPGLSKIDKVRYDLMELKNKMENINTYLNICLKKARKIQDVHEQLIELEDLEESVSKVNETIRNFERLRNQLSQV